MRAKQFFSSTSKLTRRWLGIRRPCEAGVGTVVISMVRNEQDIIEPFLRHHSALVDLIVLLDNCSTDDTRQIALGVARELGNIVVTEIPSRAYDQSNIMTRCLRHVQDVLRAKFVLPLDADEFLLADNRRCLERSLNSIAPESAGLIPWKTWLPDPTIAENQTPDPLDRLGFLRRDEAPQYYKAMLRLDGKVFPTLRLCQGNHSAVLDGSGAFPSAMVEGLSLMHCPLRSVDQLLAKGVVGWNANKARKDFDPNSGEAFQWKQLHDLAMQGHRPDEMMVAKQALNYAQERTRNFDASEVIRQPHGVRGPRRYSDGKFAPAQELIFASQHPESVLRPQFKVPRPHSVGSKSSSVPHAFDSQWHWENLFLDEPPIRFLYELRQPASVLDLGCGAGLYAALLKQLGAAEVLGVDGVDSASTVLSDSEYRQIDLQRPFDAGRVFDLVMCLEVVEHVDPSSTDVLFDTIAHHAKEVILFSMAQPGQPGNGHINCLGISEVLQLWRRRGWYPDLALSLGLRTLCSFSWLRRNVIVLTRKPDSREANWKTLDWFADLPHVWPCDRPGHREVPFMDTPIATS